MGYLSNSSIDWVIDHLHEYNDNYLLPPSFEFNAIYDCKEDIGKYISKIDIFNWGKPSKRECLVPKQHYSFRLASQYNPLDLIYYFSLIFEISETLEKYRLPYSDNIAFSNRVEINSGYAFIKNNYSEFKDYCRKMAKKYKYIVVTDISDFYYRIYSHRLENVLNKILGNTQLKSHSKAITNWISTTNYTESYGIPVGDTPSRLLAEIILDEVDKSLKHQGLIFCRWVDDYCIFANSYYEAYNQIHLIAQELYQTQGLTLQPQKTKILTNDEYISTVLDSTKTMEIENLRKKMDSFLEKIGFDDFYSIPSELLLDESTREQIKVLNLEDILLKQFDNKLPDIKIVGLLLQAIKELKSTNVISELLSKIDCLYPVFYKFIKYLIGIIDYLSDSEIKLITNKMITLINNDSLCHLEFNRTVIMELYASSDKWGPVSIIKNRERYFNEDFFFPAYIRAEGKHSEDHNIRSLKKGYGNLKEWSQRALLYALSAFQDDESKHFLNLIKKKPDSKNDFLANIIIDWSMKNPINA